MNPIKEVDMRRDTFRRDKRRRGDSLAGLAYQHRARRGQESLSRPTAPRSGSTAARGQRTSVCPIVDVPRRLCRPLLLLAAGISAIGRPAPAQNAEAAPIPFGAEPLVLELAAPLPQAAVRDIPSVGDSEAEARSEDQDRIEVNQLRPIPSVDFPDPPSVESVGSPSVPDADRILATCSIASDTGPCTLLLRKDGIRIVATRGTFPPGISPRGICVIQVAGHSKKYRYDLLPSDDGSLCAPVDLSRLVGCAVTVSLQLVSDSRDPFHGRRYQWSVFVPPDAHMLAEAAIARQGTCPISGRRLGSMGQPIPVQLASRTVYVCSPQCRDKLMRDQSMFDLQSDEFLVSSATDADQPAIDRQKVCPVMDEPLGGMGPPIKVIMGDQVVFLCCRGCIKKLKADPVKYLAKVHATTGGNAGTMK